MFINLFFRFFNQTLEGGRPGQVGRFGIYFGQILSLPWPQSMTTPYEQASVDFVLITQSGLCKLITYCKSNAKLASYRQRGKLTEIQPEWQNWSKTKDERVNRSWFMGRQSAEVPNSAVPVLQYLLGLQFQQRSPCLRAPEILLVVEILSQGKGVCLTEVSTICWPI